MCDPVRAAECTPRRRYARQIVTPSRGDGFPALAVNSLGPPSMIECCVAAPGSARAPSRQPACRDRCNIAHRTVNTKPKAIPSRS
jgi:hypothetical protein